MVAMAARALRASILQAAVIVTVVVNLLQGLIAARWVVARVATALCWFCSRMERCRRIVWGTWRRNCRRSYCPRTSVRCRRCSRRRTPSHCRCRTNPADTVWTWTGPSPAHWCIWNTPSPTSKHRWLKLIGPILWGHSGPLCHALSLLSSSSFVDIDEQAACDSGGVRQ